MLVFVIVFNIAFQLLKAEFLAFSHDHDVCNFQTKIHEALPRNQCEATRDSPKACQVIQGEIGEYHVSSKYVFIVFVLYVFIL